MRVFYKQKGCIMGNMGKSETSQHYPLAKHQEGLPGKHKTPSRVGLFVILPCDSIWFVTVS